MPPTQKISREMILDAGYKLVSISGIESVNARSLAKMLGCSTQPIFSQFPAAEELRQEIHIYTCGQFEQDVIDNPIPGPFLRSSILKLIHLARDDKNVFRLIYLSEYCAGEDFLSNRLSYTSNLMIWKEIKDHFQIDDGICADVLERVSLLVHGLATLIATSNFHYEDEKIVTLVEQTMEDIVKGNIHRRKIK